MLCNIIDRDNNIIRIFIINTFNKNAAKDFRNSNYDEINLLSLNMSFALVNSQSD